MRAMCARWAGLVWGDSGTNLRKLEVLVAAPRVDLRFLANVVVNDVALPCTALHRADAGPCVVIAAVSPTAVGP